ncbi:hypothetical protein pb186bvf_016652 [Paramecium bursaria]
MKQRTIDGTPSQTQPLYQAMFVIDYTSSLMGSSIMHSGLEVDYSNHANLLQPIDPFRRAIKQTKQKKQKNNTCTMDQRTPIQILKEEINNLPPEKLLEISQKCEQNQNVLLTQSILLIKLNKQQDALNLLKQIRDHPSYNFTRLYALYKDGQYQIVINEAKRNNADELLLVAQSLNKSEKYLESLQIYQQIIKENKFPDDQSDLMTNLVNVALQHGDEAILRQVNQQVIDYVKRQKNHYARELLLNHSLLYFQLKEYKQSKELIIRFENLVKMDNQFDDDLILAQIIQDILDQQDYQSKVKHYETIENNPEQAIILNNLAVYQERIQSHHESLKRIEQAMDIDYKFTPQQLQQLRINKAIMQIVRNRPAKEQGLPKILQIAINRQKWDKPIDDIQQFLVYATNNDNSQRILELFAVPNFEQNQVLSTFILAHLLKVDDSKFQHLLQQLKGKQTKLLCQYYIKKGELDKALEHFTDDESLKSQLALLSIEKGQAERGAQFIDSIQYQGITDMAEIENLEKNIGLSKKVEQQVKKIQKKKKKRIRYPKNFDKTNPGPLPNPERWLPKHERKEVLEVQERRQ